MRVGRGGEDDGVGLEQSGGVEFPFKHRRRKTDSHVVLHSASVFIRPIKLNSGAPKVWSGGHLWPWD